MKIDNERFYIQVKIPAFRFGFINYKKGELIRTANGRLRSFKSREGAWRFIHGYITNSDEKLINFPVRVSLGDTILTTDNIQHK